MTNTTTIYTTQNCPACKMTKKQFDNAGVGYTETLVTFEDEAVRDELREKGFSSFPVVVHESGLEFAGFDVGNIRKLIQLEKEKQ